LLLAAAVRSFEHMPPGISDRNNSKAVRASFSVAWKNARAKVPCTAGKNLFKPAAVKIARIMCSDAAAQGCATEQHWRAKCT